MEATRLADCLAWLLAEAISRCEEPLETEEQGAEMETIQVLLALLLCCSVVELLIVVLLLCFLLVPRQARHQSGRKRPQLDPGTTVAVLQQVQRLLKHGALSGNPALSDVASLVGQMQKQFGPVAELESVIQQLVLQDVRETMGEQRRAARDVPTGETYQWGRRVLGQESLIGELGS